MSYLTIKYIKGHPYLYEVESVREGDRVRQVFVRYLGRADRGDRPYIERQPIIRRRKPVSVEPEEVITEVTPPDEKEKIRDEAELAQLEKARLELEAKIIEPAPVVEVVPEVGNQKSWREMLLDKRITELYPELEELSIERGRAIDRMGEIQEAGGSGARYSAIRDKTDADLASLQIRIAKEHPALSFIGVTPPEVAVPRAKEPVVEEVKPEVTEVPVTPEVTPEAVPEVKAVRTTKAQDIGATYSIVKPQLAAVGVEEGVVETILRDVYKIQPNLDETTASVTFERLLRGDLTDDIAKENFIRESSRVILADKLGVAKIDIDMALASGPMAGRGAQLVKESIAEATNIHDALAANLPSRKQISTFIREARPPEVAVPTPKAVPEVVTPQSIARKWGDKSKNLTNLRKDIGKLTEDYDLVDVESAFEEYEGTERGDFDTQEEYKEARDETWESVLEALDSVEELVPPEVAVPRAKEIEEVKPEVVEEAPVTPEVIPEVEPKLEVKPVPVTPEVKEPWQMTKEEYRKWIEQEHISRLGKGIEQQVEEQVALLKQGKHDVNPETIRQSLIGYGWHEEQIKQALSKNKPVSLEVLKDYPDLAPKAVIETEVTPPVTEEVRGEVIRFEIGKALNKEQKDTVLKSIADTYKETGIEKTELKGEDRDGDPIYGYPYSPETFVKSDITGKMLRHYITLPDGRKAHPTELFPNIKQSEVDKAIFESERITKWHETRKTELIERARPTKDEANAIFQRATRTISGGGIDPEETTLLEHPEKGFVRVFQEGDIKALQDSGFNISWQGSKAIQPKTPVTEEVMPAPVTPEVIPEAVPEVKEPWQMTKEEYFTKVTQSPDTAIKGMRTRGATDTWVETGNIGEYRGEKTYYLRNTLTGEVREFPSADIARMESTPLTHKEIVMQALAEDKVVPPEIAGEYPELSQIKSTATEKLAEAIFGKATPQAPVTPEVTTTPAPEEVAPLAKPKVAPTPEKTEKAETEVKTRVMPTTPILSKYTEAIRPEDNTIHASFEPRENVTVDIRTRRRYGTGVPENTPEFTPQDFDIKQESNLVAETINEVDDALEKPNMRRAIKSAFHVDWGAGQRPSSKASVTVILTDESKDVGMGSAGEGSAKVFWSPYSNRTLYEKGKSKFGMLGVDPIATLAHEYHHALGGAGELDMFSDAIGAKIHLRHNLELIDPKYVKDWIWSNVNAISRSPKSHHGLEAREALGFAREGNPALFDKLLSETGYSPEALQKVKDQISITTRKWKTLEQQA